MKHYFAIFCLGVFSLTSTISSVCLAQLFPDDQAACFAVSDEVSPAQQQVINEVMGATNHRQFHFLWHQTRTDWPKLSSGDRAALLRISSEWGKNAPLCPMPGSDSAVYNPAREEFLMMHHLMIDQLSGQLAARGLPCIAGWSQIPDDNDPLWPMPPEDPNYDGDDVAKSADEGVRIHSWESYFTNADFLRAHTLSELGYLLEFTIHNHLHMRWAETPKMGDTYPDTTGEIAVPSAIASVFSGPEYHYLGNTYSSQVNPTFWKLHGWVDRVLATWLTVNNFTRISFACQPGEPGCYPWQSRWTGVGDSTPATGPVGGSAPGGAHKHHMDGEADPALDKILKKLGPHSSFRDFAFEASLREPRGGAGPGQVHTVEYLDPAEYLKAFNPCSPR